MIAPVPDEHAHPQFWAYVRARQQDHVAKARLLGAGLSRADTYLAMGPAFGRAALRVVASRVNALTPCPYERVYRDLPTLKDAIDWLQEVAWDGHRVEWQIMVVGPGQKMLWRDRVVFAADPARQAVWEQKRGIDALERTLRMVADRLPHAIAQAGQHLTPVQRVTADQALAAVRSTLRHLEPMPLAPPAPEPPS